MNLVKLIILNMLMLYFLRYDIKYGIMIMLIMVIYLIMLNKGVVEGNILEDAKREVKYMEMVNIDRLLNNLLNNYKDINKNCVGDYTGYGECDKKCGKSYKYKTYRIIEEGGLNGASCEQEDGFRMRELCDKSDGIFPCSIGHSCTEDLDCESGNCDPSTHTCSTVEVCSKDNLNLCDTRFKCVDLNNQYDYPNKTFIYDDDDDDDNCKLEENEEEEEEEEDDPEDYELGEDGTVSLPRQFSCEDRGWYMVETEGSRDNQLLQECELRGENTVYLEGDSLNERMMQYGIYTLPEGLYCEFGKKSGGDINGYTEPYISQSQIPDGGMCNQDISIDHTATDLGMCEQGYWPPLSYFRDSNQYQTNKLHIDQICNRCDNGYKYETGTCTSCSPVEDAGTVDTDPTNPTNPVRNQYNISSNIYTGYNEREVGLNDRCANTDTDLNHQIELSCSEGDNTPCDGDRFRISSDICNNPSDLSNGDCQGCCAQCNPGYKYDSNQGCVKCDINTYSNAPGVSCMPCLDGMISPTTSTDRTSCVTEQENVQLQNDRGCSISPCVLEHTEDCILNDARWGQGWHCGCQKNYLGENCEYKIVDIGIQCDDDDLGGYTKLNISECRDIHYSNDYGSPTRDFRYLKNHTLSEDCYYYNINRWMYDSIYNDHTPYERSAPIIVSSSSYIEEINNIQPIGTSTDGADEGRICKKT